MADSMFRKLTYAICNATAVPGYKCVCERDGRDPETSAGDACGEATASVVAAIEVLYTPTSAMLKYAYECADDRLNALDCWQAMLDAADDRPASSLPETP